MRTVLAISTALVLSASAAVLPAAAQEQTAAGTWTGTADGIAGIRQAHQTFTMVLAQEGNTVSGTYATKFEVKGRESTVRVNGTLTGDKLLLTVGPHGRLQATVNGDSLTGSLERENNNPLRVSAARAAH
jgi:hypothetical protein